MLHQPSLIAAPRLLARRRLSLVLRFVVGLGAVATLGVLTHEAFASRRSTKPPAATVAAGMPAVDAPDGDFAGTVEERLAAGTYTYMRVRSSRGSDWVVTLGAGRPVGTDVAVTNFGVRNQFESRRLDRTFDHLVFGIVR